MKHIITSQKSLLPVLGGLYLKYSRTGDADSAAKMKSLIHKERNSERLIAFCGHFSAGKSSMINALLGKELLPSSPVPTSANIVKISKGGDSAKVFFREGAPVLYPAPYDYGMVKSYCKKGDEISAIEISTPDFPLENNSAIMDTPGIDSADDAHKASTEEAIHLADIVFYVMDYNHVQSEVNFLFAKDVAASGKTLYLIVNQIDKHDETELTFDEFADSVSQSFLSWDVKPDAIFYTSLKNPGLARNDFEKVKELIKDFSEQEQKPDTAGRAAVQIAGEHMAWLRREKSGELSSWQKIIGETESDQDGTLTDPAELESEKKNAEQAASEALAAFNSRLQTILNNAYLMPASTRALAESYLESTKKDFKVGMFFSKSKTEQERKSRFMALKKDLTDKAESQLERHIKELCISILKEHELFDGELEEKARTFSIDIPDSLMEEPVKSQVQITGQYVLVFTQELADGLKKEAKSAIRPFLDKFAEAARRKMNEKVLKLDKELGRHSELIQAKKKIEAAQEWIDKEESEIEAYLNGEKTPDLSTDIMQLFKQWDGEENNYRVVVSDEMEFEENAGQRSAEYPSIPVNSTVEKKEETDIEAIAEKLSRTSILLKDKKGFQHISRDLEAQASRLANQTFTVALFGAFSAGKSSFANALLGDKVLPVSPNPTTAAINKICPPDSANPHGTARVKLKEKAMLLEDVRLAFSFYDTEISTLEEAVLKAGAILEEPAGMGAHNSHASFLRAFLEGYPLLAAKLGTEIIVDIDSFRDYAANEKKSCMVDWIELYYDCEITRKGIILTDTPGADSVNARHTGTAFDYIKNSDAILFVTYYNHSFSKADREFLIQLGRVKDSFSMDKMFFIINAVDLAGSKDELDEVAGYVSGQLGSFQIRKPKIYPLSSKSALEEKQGRDPLKQHFLSGSGLPDFERDFNRFLEEDLTGIAAASAASSLHRAENMLKEVIAASRLDQAEKEAQKKQQEDELKKISAIIEKTDLELDLSRLRTEILDLAFYCKQRVFLRFNDFFREAFSPAALKDDGRDLKKALKLSLQELLSSTGFDLAQEMRATTVRSEVYMNKLLKQHYNNWAVQIKEIRNGLEMSEIQTVMIEVPDFQPGFKSLNEADFKKELSLFKNPRSFFEKKESVRMKDSLQSALEPLAEEYLKSQAERLFEECRQIYQQTVSSLKEQLKGEILEIYEGYKEAYSRAEIIEDCESALEYLQASH
ncbi:dynamin family protein [Peribacillus sp. SCS-37]|uniref:dynamin family protein n=1 Tax=Paraperibacillus esterisolvens TaxID=3115296 RepID=UPI003905C7FF